MAKINLNGKIIDIRKASLSVLDRGFLYGDGVFESFRTYDQKPFMLEEHIKRLVAGAKKIGIRVPFSSSRLKLMVQKTMAANSFKEYYIKIILTRGEAREQGLDPSKAKGKPNLIILAQGFKPPTKAVFDKGWKAIIASVQRADIPTSHIKSLCYLDNILARAEAARAGADEALMLNEKGHLAEGSTSNLFIIKSGIISTPPLNEPILSGITRALVMEALKSNHMEINEKILRPKDIFNCDECFLTLSSLGIVPVTRIHDQKIGNGRCGPITRRLISIYQAEIRKANIK